MQAVVIKNIGSNKKQWRLMIWGDALYGNLDCIKHLFVLVFRQGAVIPWFDLGCNYIR